MAILFHAAWLLVAAAIHTSAGCDMFLLGPCSADCGTGYAEGTLACADGGNCGALNLTCNMESCAGNDGAWSECSASCGNGTVPTKKRTVGGNVTETIACNVHNCAPAECSECSGGDIVFLIDESSSITNFGFELAKQVVTDTISGLPSCVRVSVLTFATEVKVVVDMGTPPAVGAILDSQFSGGCGLMVYGLAAAELIFRDTPAGEPKILATLSDGEQMIMESCSNDIAVAMRAVGVTMLSAVAPGALPYLLYPVTSANFSDNQVLLANPLAAIGLTKAIRNLVNCPTTESAITPALNNTDLDKSMAAGVMMAGPGKQCTGWKSWSKCNVPCGMPDGRQQSEQTCTDERGESITEFKFQNCKTKCPPKPIVVDETLCTLEDWMRGKVHIPHPANCHLYFVCERVYNDKFRMHGMDCGALFWNQKTLVCEATSPTNNVVKCKDVKDKVWRPPVIGAPSDCGGDDQLLQFDFENGFEDSCGGPALIQKGRTDVTLEEQIGNNVACFDGTSAAMEIPYLKSWFAGKKVTAFTVAIWYYRHSLDTRSEQGLVHNGGCLATNTGFQVTTGYGGSFAGVTTRDSFPPGLKQLFAVTAPNSNWLEPAGWQQAVLVWNGVDGDNGVEGVEKLYLQGYERERAPAEGFMLRGNTNAFLGRLCRDKFFGGCVDNLRIWNRALTAGEVLALQKN